MKIINRFTRDRVSRYIWGGLALACLATVLFAVQQQRRGLASEVAAVQAHTRGIANTVLFDNLVYGTLIAPIPAPLYRDIIVSLQSSVFTDENAARVRIWRPDGTLQFSTHERDKVGRLRTQNKTLIDKAMQGDTVSARVSTPFSAASTGNDQTPTNLLEVFVPLHVPDRIAVAGVAEVDYYYDNLVRAAHDQWFKFIVFFAVAAALCLIMTIRSFRTPVKTLGADVGGSAGQAPDQPTDEAVKSVVQKAQRAEARATKAEADLVGARAQLQQMQADLVLATAISEDSTRVAELRESLTRAEAQIAAMALDHPADTRQPPVNELERDIVLVSRAHTAERRMREAEERASAAEDEARKQADRARAAEDAATAARVVASPESTPAPPATDDPVLAQIEGRVASAERRAEDAEARLKKLRKTPAAVAEGAIAAETDAAADDLRARLARTASRKKPGGGDGSPAPTRPA